MSLQIICCYVLVYGKYNPVVATTLVLPVLGLLKRGKTVVAQLIGQPIFTVVYRVGSPGLQRKGSNKPSTYWRSSAWLSIWPAGRDLGRISI